MTYDVALDRTAVTGNGVHCFIIDSGVSNYHEEFTGRVVSEFDAFTGASTQEDDFGHGTKGFIISVLVWFLAFES